MKIKNVLCDIAIKKNGLEFYRKRHRQNTRLNGLRRTVCVSKPYGLFFFGGSGKRKSPPTRWKSLTRQRLNNTFTTRIVWRRSCMYSVRPVYPYTILYVLFAGCRNVHAAAGVLCVSIIIHHQLCTSVGVVVVVVVVIVVIVAGSCAQRWPRARTLQYIVNYARPRSTR